jgi:cytoskeletal protein CcmA (bactofilin family)
MFKRGEESEWSRFSKAFTTKERERDALDTGLEDEPTLLNSDASASVDLTAAPATSPAARPPTTDTNLTVARTGSLAMTPHSGNDDDVETTIGENSFFDGTCRSENSIRVRGTAQGEIESSRSVYVEERAKVSAKVTAASIMVAGEVNGELSCSGRVEIRPSGRVTGTINAGTLVMQEGAFFDGNLKMKQEAEFSPITNRQQS